MVTSYIDGVEYEGPTVRYPKEGSCVKGFAMVITSSDTNGQNINLLSGVIDDLIVQVDILKAELEGIKSKA